ncbi:hypothetical protein OXB_2869 [Bacillus sp. OxB-1]|uniref:hypothetical protein n=1 Tax=Bacillus sp. (strain OxB-1) TaxID=98228 RepID=UPI000581C232|nr:hypothetical protein [Bacillus sp. OxB-1]BAQ11340.1 hypothetical protein OXB_2869 [Bacillus sp. OxB-1]
MIGTFVKPSRETEKLVLIEELNRLGIYETMKREPLESLSYYSLRTLLATRMEVAE